MDPVTILAAATAAYNGVKKAVELGREVSDIYSQLGTWAGHVGDLKNCIDGIESSEASSSIWKKITFDKSETAEAFDVFAAKQKLKEMEDEIFHMFLYGELCHLGLDGYREFKQMRKDIHEKRAKMIENQIAARKGFIDQVKITLIIALVTIFATSIVWGTIELVLAYA